MSRPEYLNCIMTPNVIRGIKERQDEYDKDPEAYEERVRQYKEQILQEEQEKIEDYNQQEQQQND